MSDAHHSDHAAHHDTHQGGHAYKPVSQGVLVFVVVALVALLALLSHLGQPKPINVVVGNRDMNAESVARRIQPVGSIELKDSSAAAALKTGEQAFQAQCSACHTTGAAGAPKLGDEAAWGPRIKAGFEALLASAMKGKGNMPPQGAGDLSETEVARAVVYLANKGGAKFNEPKAPAAAASAVEPAASATK
jgi:cytochrome c5